MISLETCRRVLEAAVRTGADYAEIYAENTVNHVINMVSGKVDSINDGVTAGASVRVFKGLRSVMATTIDTSEKGLLKCADRAAEALGEGTAAMEIVLRERLYGDVHPVKVVPSSVGNREKIDILRTGCDAAAAYGKCIVQTTGRFLDVDHQIQIANTDGVFAEDRQIRTRLSVTAVADTGKGRQTGSCSPGRRMGLEMFETEVDAAAAGREAARQASVMADAGYCPGGMMPVAIDNGFGGVIFHEACGHSLEATSVAYG